MKEKEEQIKKQWLEEINDRAVIPVKNLSSELKDMKNALTGDAYKLYTDIWDSAVASGQVSLLDSEQITKLTKVYRHIKGTDYEAVRVRDAKEAYNQNSHPTTKKDLMNIWANLSEIHLRRMETSRGMIEEILKEKWWPK